MYHLENTTIDVPDHVRRILETIREAGFEAYIVGGCVRDSILGRIPGDWDITTSALPEQVKSLFRATVDSGIQHGTVMVIMGGCGYEVTTYRIDGTYKDGRHPERVTFTPSLEEDLKRRDFTINAFAYSPGEGVVDLFGGIEDLKRGIIRAVGDPMKRFDEDALRIMRAVRFAAQLGFEIEPETRKAISCFASRLKMVSSERIRVEFEKTLFSDNPSMVNEFREFGDTIIPGFADKCFNADIPPVSNPVRLAVFFRELAPEDVKKLMRKMTFDNASRDTVAGILKYKNIKIPADRVGIKKILKETGAELFRFVLEFHGSQGKDVSKPERILSDIIESGEAFAVGMLGVNGEDLIKTGIPQGAEIGKKLSWLLDKVIEQPELNDKGILLNLLKE